MKAARYAGFDAGDVVATTGQQAPHRPALPRVRRPLSEVLRTLGAIKAAAPTLVRPKPSARPTDLTRLEALVQAQETFARTMGVRP